ncbi:hypothetical protein CTA1_10678 [Colletotrichum tanaceti]|uniref:Uncharacterized protein n=1 Tax=Colletotrichum tanaceti TaxID=1306861 RepID=A0A4U6XIV3_9PEZI|nr:hypothetical protein CTA1_10678 [Colletotrichum tanaceti]
MPTTLVAALRRRRRRRLVRVDVGAKGAVDLLVGAGDEDLDDLALLDLLEGLLGLLELDDAGDELLDVDAAVGDEVDGELVVARAVAEAAAGRHLLEAQGHDGEVDVGLAHAALDVGAAHADDVQAGLDGRLGAAGVDDGVGAGAEPALVDQGAGVLLGRDAARQVGVRRGQVAGEVELGLDNVDADDLCGAKGAGDGGAEQADGAGAHDDDGGAGGHAGLLGDVDGDGQRLDERALLQRDVVRQLVAKVGGRDPEAGEGAVVGGRGGEAHLGAEVVVAGEAVGAAAARVARLEGHAVADAERLDALAHLDDGAGRLVAEHHRVLDHEVPDGAVLPVVHVRAADARVVDGHEHIVGLRDRGDRALGELDVVRLVEDEGEVLRAGC